MYIRLLCSFFALLLCTATAAEATHFRFGHTTWRRVSDNLDGSVTVEFISTQAWRATAPDMLGLSFGDGNFYFPANNEITDIFTGSDLAGEGYIIRRYIVQHTYSALDITNNGGVFLAEGSSCCRISTLINAPDDSMRVGVEVNLLNGNQGSAVSNIPVILQMSVGQVNTLPLGAVDPDGDTLGCRMATSGESFITNLATLGSAPVAVSSGCVLSWDLSGSTLADVGKKFAVQVKVDETNRCSVGGGNGGGQGSSAALGLANVCSSVSLDFIIELVEGNPPSCVSSKPTNNVLYAGRSFSASFTGSDVDPGAVLTVTSFGAPAGSNLSPVSGSTQAAPFTATFEWTPAEVDRGTAHSVLITYQDDTGLQSVCALGLQVSANDPVFSCTPVDIAAQLFALDGNSHSQQLLAIQAAKQIKKLKIKNAAKQAQALVKLAKDAYQTNWTTVWTKLPSLSQDCSASPNVEFCSTVAVNNAPLSEYIAGANTLNTLLLDAANKISKAGKKTYAKSLKASAQKLLNEANGVLGTLPANTQICQ